MTALTAKQWVQSWKAAGPKLQAIQNEELRNLSESEGTRKATMLGIAGAPRRRTTSGLIEYQRIMRSAQPHR